MPKARAPHNPLSAILRAVRKPVEVEVESAGGEKEVLTLRMPGAGARARLLDMVSGGAEVTGSVMLALVESAVREAGGYGAEVPDADISDLVAGSGGPQGELAQTALRLCGLAKAGKREGKESPLPTG